MPPTQRFRTVILTPSEAEGEGSLFELLDFVITGLLQTRGESVEEHAFSRALNAHIFLSRA
jgi:hypothetical protein